MWKKTQIKVLSDLRLILKLTNLYNKNGVHIGSYKIPDFFVFCLICLPSLYVAALLIWSVIEENFNLTLISMSLAAAIGHIQIAVAYMSLCMKSELIAITVDHLQDVVEKSKFELLYFQFRLRYSCKISQTRVICEF